MRVSPFRYPRLSGYLLLPAAFRSLSRLSSAPSAKASALCPSSLNLSSCIALHSLFSASSWLLFFLVCLLAWIFLLLSRYSVFKEHFQQSYSRPKPPAFSERLGRHTTLWLSSFIRRPPILPCRLQHSTFGRLRLNRRVRYGYGTKVPRVSPTGALPPDFLTCPSADKQ